MLGEAGIDALIGMVTGGISLAGKGGKVLKYADDVGDLAKRKYSGAYEKTDDVLFSPMDSANSNTNKKFKEALQSRKNNDIVITEKQFGKKNREHAKDYGLDPGNEDDRIKLLNIIDDIIDNAEEVVRGKWKCQDGPVLFYRKGEDLVLVREKDGNFISIFQGSK